MGKRNRLLILSILEMKMGALMQEFFKIFSAENYSFYQFERASYKKTREKRHGKYTK